ncbi:MAG: NADPH-dependent F420 reductase [Chloroflexi bacterium HGW-Chloroflexi-2]|nr:MAG: NADPH-dependent F420 reductase [Chloroflexi bacterium HGW-Chloroflexi-2]
MKIAILGGTGKEGMGIGYRWAKAGHEITIGSRQESKALDAAAKLQEMLGNEIKIAGKENLEAAKEAELLVLTVPFNAHKAMCEYIKEASQGKIVIDVTVPLVPPKVTKVQMPPAGSATLEAKEIFGENTSVVAAFQNISYEHLVEDGEVACDVLVTGDSKASREAVIKLVQEAGLVGIDAGPIENSVVVEGLTSILIGINKQFGINDAGIKITGIS